MNNTRKYNTDNANTRTYYGTLLETYYRDSKGQGWLIQSVDPLPSSQRCDIPELAVEVRSVDDSHRAAAAEIESL